jgi:hypothetical protein
MTATQTTLETLNTGLVALRGAMQTLSSTGAGWKGAGDKSETVDCIRDLKWNIHDWADSLCKSASTDLLAELPQGYVDGVEVSSSVYFGRQHFGGAMLTVSSSLNFLDVTHVRISVTEICESRSPTVRTHQLDWHRIDGAEVGPVLDLLIARVRAKLPPGC